MIPSNTIKKAQAEQIAKAYKAWLKAGHKPEQLPGVGSGHVLTNTYSLRNHDAATVIKGAK
tara:strand:+ start:141 stop:323 length:183 start_codon:yes stop_codon:yes gene_type:complete